MFSVAMRNYFHQQTKFLHLSTDKNLPERLPASFLQVPFNIAISLMQREI